MRTYYIISLTLLLAFLALFGLVAWLDIALLSDPSYIMNKGGLLAGLAGVGLLASDIILPVPGSLVMVANGALFGIWLGTLLSLIGGLLSSWIGFAIGRRGAKIIHKIASAEEQERAEQMLQKWGIFAVIVSRPVPLIGETISVMAGASTLPMYKLILASIVGVLPAAILYAAVGVYATELKAGIIGTVAVVILAGIVWAIGKRMNRSKTPKAA